MKKKLSIKKLTVTSFITNQENSLKGGLSYVCSVGHTGCEAPSVSCPEPPNTGLIGCLTQAGTCACPVEK